MRPTEKKTPASKQTTKGTDTRLANPSPTHPHISRGTIGHSQAAESNGPMGDEEGRHNQTLKVPTTGLSCRRDTHQRHRKDTPNMGPVSPLKPQLCCFNPRDIFRHQESRRDAPERQFVFWGFFSLQTVFAREKGCTWRARRQAFPQSVHVKTVRCSQSQTAPLSFSTTMWGKKIYKARPQDKPLPEHRAQASLPVHSTLPVPIGEHASQHSERPSRLSVGTGCREHEPSGSIGGRGQRFMV